MESGNELTVFEVSAQALLKRHLSRSRKQRVPRFLGKLGSDTGADGRHSAGYEGSCFLGHCAGLENQMQSRTNCNTNQQFERQVRYPAVHDLAQRGLRYTQQLRCGCLIQLLSLHGASDLQSNIAAQCLDSRYVFFGIHSALTISLSYSL